MWSKHIRYVTKPKEVQMKTIILVFLSFITSSVYARSNSCPKAELSEVQETQIQDYKQAAEANFETLILDTVPVSEEQKVVLAECFKNKKRFCPKAELSEVQETQIKELLENFKAASHDMHWKDKKAAWRELEKTILDIVSASEEQQTATAKCLKHWKRHKRKHRKFCPEAELSEEQKTQIRDQRQATRIELQNYILDTVSASEDQKAALSAYFECKNESRRERRKKH